MRYELVVDESKYEEFINFENHKRGFVLFRLVEDKSKLFILAHGSKDGLIDLGGSKLFSLKEVLEMLLLKDVIHKNGVKEVYTISCYGGYQTPAIVESIEIKSCHESKNAIHAKAFMTLDEECVLEINID